MQQTHYTQVCTLVFFCPIGFQIFMSGGFFTPCKGFPEGCSCPAALFDTCNGVFEILLVVYLLLPLTPPPPPPSFCTVHSDYVGVV